MPLGNLASLRYFLPELAITATILLLLVAHVAGRDRRRGSCGQDAGRVLPLPPLGAARDVPPFLGRRHRDALPRARAGLDPLVPARRLPEGEGVLHRGVDEVRRLRGDRLGGDDLRILAPVRHDGIDADLRDRARSYLGGGGPAGGAGGRGGGRGGRVQG